MNTFKIQVRQNIKDAMARPANIDKSSESMARILAAVSGVSRHQIAKFIDGDDTAITDAECKAIDSLK